MTKEPIIINGNNFSDIEGFYDEIDRVLTKDLDWQTGHNYNAFNDLLNGGFGIHEYREDIEIIWIHFSKSSAKLGKDITKILLEIITDHAYHIKFETID